MKSCLFALSLCLIAFNAQADLISFNTSASEGPQGIRKVNVDLGNGRELVFTEVCILETQNGFELVTPTKFFQSLEGESIKVAVDLVDLDQGGMRNVRRVLDSKNAVDYADLIPLSNHPDQVQENWIPSDDRHYLTLRDRQQRLNNGDMGSIFPVQKISYLGQDERGGYTFFLKLLSERNHERLVQVERMETTKFEKHHVEINQTVFGHLSGPNSDSLSELQGVGEKALALASDIKKTKLSLILSQRTSLSQRVEVRSSVSELLGKFKNLEDLLKSLGLEPTSPPIFYRKTPSSKPDEITKLEEIRNQLYIWRGDLIEFDKENKTIRTLSADQVVFPVGSLNEPSKGRVFIDTAESGVGSIFLKVGHLANISSLNKFKNELKKGLSDFLRAFEQGVGKGEYLLSEQKRILGELENIFRFSQGLPKLLVNLSSEREEATIVQGFIPLGEFVAFSGATKFPEKNRKKSANNLRLRPTNLELQNEPASELELVEEVRRLKWIQKVYIKPGKDELPQEVLFKDDKGIIYYLDDRGGVPTVEKIHVSNAYQGCTLLFNGGFKFELLDGGRRLL